MSSECAVSLLKAKYKYFIKNFEYNVQIIIDDICASKNLGFVKVNQLIRRGNLYLKADYYIPLKSIETFQLNCEELLRSLRQIEYLLDVEVDSNFNLTFCFKRPDIYSVVLDEVMKYSETYGMTEKSNSVLVIIYNSDSNDFINKRICIQADHIISLLTANKVNVHFNYFNSYLKPSHENGVELICSENCCIEPLSHQMHENLKISNYRKKESETMDRLCIDAKAYLEQNSLLNNYGKDINSIVIDVEDENDVLCKASVIEHLIHSHMSIKPNNVIHIASHGINRFIWKIGILLQMQNNSNFTQTYIFNQNVKSANESDVTTVEYLQSYRNIIEKAMTQKYSVDICKDKTWSSRIENLVDTVVKFDFLKLNPNMILKIDPLSNQNTEKNTGIFVQYNFARLSNLFKNFEIKVKEGYYEPLLPLKDVDFSLLRLEEEWNLFQFVVLFPKLVERVLDSLISESTVKTRYPMNGICLMLSELCHYLSLYYSKIRILAGPQKHLQNLMNARLWLLKGIYKILMNSFLLLNTQGLDLM